MKQQEPPTAWSVRNGAFVGYCQVQAPEVTIGGYKPKDAKPKEHWLLFCVDLRGITHIREHSQEHPEWAVIYHGSEHIATINARAADLMDHWLPLLHAFERIPSTDEARYGKTLSQIDREAITIKPKE